MTCEDCGGARPSSRHKYCAACAKVRHTASVQKWNTDNGARVKEWRHGYYLSRKALYTERARRWREANADRERERRRKLREQNPGLQADYTRKSKYGITRERLAEMLAAQGGKCAICQSTSPGIGTKNWHIDHDHAFEPNDPRGHRGLLCHGCNVGLGCFKDSITIIQAAAEHLDGHALQLQLATQRRSRAA